jgi:hypothetical protein
LGSIVNIYIKFCLQIHLKVSAVLYCFHYLSLTPVANLPPVSLTLVAKFAAVPMLLIAVANLPPVSLIPAAILPPVLI